MDRLWNSNYIKAWSANFMLYFSFMILTPLLPLYLGEELGASKEQIGWVLCGYSLTALLIRPFSGFLVDSFPRKRVLLICYSLFALLFGGYLLVGSLAAFCVIRTLHGAPLGATTVSNSTVAMDVLHPTRRAEGIGYYGLSNNLATAFAPTVGILIYQFTSSYQVLFALAFIIGLLGVLINSTLHIAERPLNKEARRLSLDRFFLLRGWSQSICVTCFAFSYGVLSTYVAVYAKERLGITTGAGIFFALLSVGLFMSRLIGAKSLREGRVVTNATHGILVSLVGYLIFALIQHPVGFYLSAFIVGLGNGHMFPAMQTMFINLAPHNQRGTANGTLLTAWDLGVGIGIVLGGILLEYFSYEAAFWLAWIVNVMGAVHFFLHARIYYARHSRIGLVES